MENKCIKQQREVILGGEMQHRCINKEASRFLTVVQDSDCGACPVRMIMAAKGGCAKGTTAVQANRVVPLEVIQDGYKTCAFRVNRSCSISGQRVTPENCEACVGEAEAEAVRSGFTAKAFAYVDAIKRWVQSGRPRRTEEEVERIFNDHCKGCFRFNAVTKSCESCGCVVAPHGHPLNNKISMATESCPLGQW